MGWVMNQLWTTRTTDEHDMLFLCYTHFDGAGEILLKLRNISSMPYTNVTPVVSSSQFH